MKEGDMQVIRYSTNASSVVKAVILGHILGKSYAAMQEADTGNLFAQGEIAADDYNLAELAQQYVQLTGRNLDWLQDNRVSCFYTRINYALRHSSPAKFRLIESAIEDALKYGLEYFLSNVSTSCRRFRDMAREVSHEVQRMLGYIRFTSPAEQTLVAKPKLFHDTADLILRKFQARYPHYRIILVLEDRALALERGQITALTLQEVIPLLPETDPYEGIWQEYYKSQYIQGRKNIPLASKAIPQKYWDWMPEGQILQEEKEAVDKPPPALLQQKFRP